MSLGDHLEELRRRIIYSLYGLLPIASIALVFGQPLLKVLLRPVRESLHRAHQPDDILAIAPQEVFYEGLKVSFIAAILVGGPWILYQLWLFVSPGLYSREKRFVYFLIPLSTVLGTAGALFFYYLILPVILKFFIEYGGGALSGPPPATVEVPPEVVLGHAPVLAGDPVHPAVGDYWINTETSQIRFCIAEGRIGHTSLRFGEGIVPEFRVSESIKMILMFSLGFIAGFQTPVVVLLLGWAGMIDVAFLRKYRKHALLVIAIVAALLTPADPFSMVMMMVPLCLLYELGALLLKWFPASRVAGGGPKRGDPAIDVALPGREPADAGDP